MSARGHRILQIETGGSHILGLGSRKATGDRARPSRELPRVEYLERGTGFEAAILCPA